MTLEQLHHVRALLSESFVDSWVDYAWIARELAPFDLAELKRIFYEEVAPICYYNIVAPVPPVWTGFEPVSLNEEIVHGIPSAKRVLKDGDIITVDIGVYYGGFHTDSAWTYAVGNISDEAKRLMQVTELGPATAVELAAPHLASGTLVRVLSPWITGRFTLYAALPSRKFLPQRTQVFLDHLTERTRERVAEALAGCSVC